MRVIGQSDEAEMIATFLRGEIGARRYAPTIAAIMARERIARSIIETPNLADPAENAARRALLGAFRGYGDDRELFAGFPATLRWEWAALHRDELARIRYIAYDYWVALSGGSRLAPDAAQQIAAGVTIFGVPNDGFRALAAAWRSGVRLPPLIVVGTEAGGPLVLLEGHARLTAYFLAAEAAPPELVALVGWSPALPQWQFY